MHYSNYHFGGMHLIWWFVWGIFLFWIFATPYNIPWQKTKKDSPLDILKRRFAAGEMSSEEFLEKKQHLQD